MEWKVADGPPPLDGGYRRRGVGPWFAFAQRVREADGRWVMATATSGTAARAVRARLTAWPTAPSAIGQPGEFEAVTRGAEVWARLAAGSHSGEST
jgi:hypothetical protein